MLRVNSVRLDDFPKILTDSVLPIFLSSRRTDKITTKMYFYLCDKIMLIVSYNEYNIGNQLIMLFGVIVLFMLRFSCAELSTIHIILINNFYEQ